MKKEENPFISLDVLNDIKQRIENNFITKKDIEYIDFWCDALLNYSFKVYVFELLAESVSKKEDFRIHNYFQGYLKGCLNKLIERL